MVLNAAVQMLREADELKQKILKFKSGTSMLQERSLWVTQQQLQKVYQKVLVLDLDYALDKKVEQDLWNIGFKQQIEALQAISKDRKNPLRSEGQAMLSWVLQAAAGFYLCLLHQICTAFKLDLPFRRRASLLGCVSGWALSGAGGAAGARYATQHCLVHLGDLARYRQQLRVAHTFYRHALVVSCHSGQPYNQLALVSWRRGRRLGAIYWHVRSLLVRAPFPPAPANLARTLAAAAQQRENKDLPVLPGVTSPVEPVVPFDAPAHLDSHSYVTELIKAIHLIHTGDDLETAEALVESLSASLAVLIAADGFESMTLIKMTCVLIWLVHSTTEDLTLDCQALTPSEAKAATLAHSLSAAAAIALAVTAPAHHNAVPALNVYLQWVSGRPEAARAAGLHRPAVWPALARAFNALAEAADDAGDDDHAEDSDDKYATVPLPEDRELQGFLPLEASHEHLRFNEHTDEHTDIQSSPSLSATCFSNSPALEAKERVRRVIARGRRLADLLPDKMTYVEEESKTTFTATGDDTEQLTLQLATLTASPRPLLGYGLGGDDEGDSDDDARPPPPVVISEADFREKVREKRVGILKPQGSLERAREERAMACTQEEQEADTSEESSKSEDKKEAKKARVNIAMAAIMRKQEETNKQVKFITPPPTPESTTDDKDQPKMIHPKAIKSLANLPIGRKTGGILSLKDKSAGYPHLVNAEPEKEDKKEIKPIQGSSQNSQSYQQKREIPNWSPNIAPPTYNEPRTFLKNYGIQTPGLNYNQGYQQMNVGNQGIRLPVVNPKEIDVRTAALQKQNSRHEIFQDGQKFGNLNYQISGDKKNFLNDLPPRFANQYRYWQSSQENQYNDNKFRDDFNKNPQFNPQRSWVGQPPNPVENFQPNQWWKPENPPSSFNPNFSVPPPMNMPNFYQPQMSTNLPNPYQNVSYNQMPNTIGQKDIRPPSYLQSAIGQPQMQTLQNLVSSPNFSSSLSSFGTYAPPVSYDSSMYPQFNNKLGYQPMQMKMMDKPPYQGTKDVMDMGLGFGNTLDMQQQNLGMNFNEPLNSDAGNNLDQLGQRAGVSEAPNTYSLFSGAADTSAWAAGQRPPHQSLWSGPGPSPLERLLEQQKQLKQPTPPQ